MALRREELVPQFRVERCFSRVEMLPYLAGRALIGIGCRPSAHHTPPQPAPCADVSDSLDPKHTRMAFFSTREEARGRDRGTQTAYLLDPRQPPHIFTAPPGKRVPLAILTADLDTAGRRATVTPGNVRTSPRHPVDRLFRWRGDVCRHETQTTKSCAGRARLSCCLKG